LTQGSVWMRFLPLLMLILLVSGCANAVSKPAVCDGTAQARTEHALTLSQSPHNPSVLTGARLIQLLDAGCGD
jgi:uncharacterized protein YceK